MILSSAQVSRFWREWSAACKAMNWTTKAGMNAAAVDANRKELLARCGFDSLTEVDRTDGFTKVLSEVMVLQGTSLKAAAEAEDPTLNKARVLRHQILTILVPCYEFYEPNAMEEITGIMEDKNRWWRIDHQPTRRISILDLDAKPYWRFDKKTKQRKMSPSPLEQMQWTIARRLDAKRQAAGHTVHQMKTLAKVPCDCAQCKPKRAAVLMLEKIPEPEEAPNPF
jgi:hypothetical protein